MIGREMASLREQLDQMHSRAVLAEEERDEVVSRHLAHVNKLVRDKDALQTLLAARATELWVLRETLYRLSKGV